MRKGIIEVVIAAVVFGILVLGMIKTPRSVPNIALMNAHRSSVTIAAGDLAKDCSGIVVSDVLAITAAHCIADFDKMKEVLTGNGYTVRENLKIYQKSLGISEKVKVAYFVGPADYAILKGNFSNMNYTSVARNYVHFPIGSTYLKCGYPGRSNILRCVEAKVIGYRLDLVRTDARTVFGESGGGVFDQSTGKIVGIGVNLVRKVPGGSEFRPVSEIIDVILNQEREPTNDN